MWRLRAIDYEDDLGRAVQDVRNKYLPSNGQPLDRLYLNDSGKLLYEKALRLRLTGPDLDNIHEACSFELDTMERTAEVPR
jgi:hypothetical protein